MKGTDWNKLISAQSKISMGVKRKGELAHKLDILNKKMDNKKILCHFVQFSVSTFYANCLKDSHNWKR